MATASLCHLCWGSGVLDQQGGYASQQTSSRCFSAIETTAPLQPWLDTLHQLGFYFNYNDQGELLDSHQVLPRPASEPNMPALAKLGLSKPSFCPSGATAAATCIDDTSFWHGQPSAWGSTAVPSTTTSSSHPNTLSLGLVDPALAFCSNIDATNVEIPGYNESYSKDAGKDMALPSSLNPPRLATAGARARTNSGAGGGCGVNKSALSIDNAHHGRVIEGCFEEFEKLCPAK